MTITNLPMTISTNKLQNFKQKIWKALLSSPNSYRSNKILFLSKIIEELNWENRLQSADIPETNKIFTYTNIRELRTLYELAANCPHGSIALEIGSHLGASSCYIAAGLSKIDGHLLCVDTWNNETMPEGKQDTFAEFQKNIKGVSKQITPIRKRSEDIDKTDIKNPLNLVFIDGDHSYEGVKRDFEFIQKWLGDDGIIAFHDFSEPYFQGVTRVVGEAIASGKWILLGKVDTLAWIKRAKWLQPTWNNK